MTNIIIFLACTLAGFAIGKYFEKRLSEKGVFYQDIRKYVIALKENIGGRQLVLDEFNREFSESSSKTFSEYIYDRKIRCTLSPNQKKNLTMFFDNLDCASSVQLSSHIDYYGKLLEEDCKLVAEKETSKVSVYGKLGMLLGAMLGIVLM